MTPEERARLREFWQHARIVGHVEAIGYLDAALTDVPRLLDALDAAEARIAAVEALCEEASAEAVGGGRTDVDTLWPSDILAALAGKRKP